MARTQNERTVESGGPARELVLVTKADSDLAVSLLGFRVYVASADAPATVKFTPLDSEDAVTLTYNAGVHWEPVGARRVWSTGSTANAVVHGVPARPVNN